MKHFTLTNLARFNPIENASLRDLSTFKIGGTARYLFFPKTQSELIELFQYLDDNKIPCFIFGRASNILFADEMSTEIAVSTKFMKGLMVEKHQFTVEAGLSLRELCYQCVENDFTGLEGLSGIPGTVGGAVYMNAGAYGYMISDFLQEVAVYDRQKRKVLIYNKEACAFGYRESRFMEQNQIILSITMTLNKGLKKVIMDTMKSYELKRAKKQPLDYPSAGSVFKKPSLAFHPAAVIEDLGLKGFCVGDACVSSKHSGFIINKKDATSNDVKKLIHIIREKVYKKTGIILETEIDFFD